MNGYKLLDEWELNANIVVRVKYEISISYFDIFVLENLIQFS